MSGDHGLRVSIPAALRALSDNPDIHLHLVGNQVALEQALSQANPAERSRLHLCHADSTLASEASLSEVLRQAPDSSLHGSLHLLEQGEVQAVVSAGPTGPLMALARRQLGMLPGFSRPAACSALPVRSGHTHMLDLGANVDCNAVQLVEFARMGSALVTALEGTESPRVALLNNGSEPSRGNAVIREAAIQLEQEPGLNFAGFVEGDRMFSGEVEVIVCDGMLGNVALKVAEGTATLATELIAERYAEHWWSRLLGLISARQLGGLRRSLSAELHGGAFLLGLNGVVVKCHGGASDTGFAAAIGEAASCVNHDMVGRMARQL